MDRQCLKNMVERQPIPIPAHHSPREGGNGAPGIPPTLHERAKPPPERQERQPLPDILDILEQRAQLMEGEWTGKIAMRKLREAQKEQGHELARQWAHGTPRVQLIVDVYTTMTKSNSWESVSWTSYISPQKTRDLIARVEPMNEEELHEELGRQEEALERRTQAHHKMRDTRIRNERLTPKQREKERKTRQRKYRKTHREEYLEYQRQRYRERKEGRRLEAEKQQQTQVFPPPGQE